MLAARAQFCRLRCDGVARIARPGFAPAAAGYCAATRRPRGGLAVAYIRIARPPNVTADTYEKVNEQLGVGTDPPPGLLLHCAGEADGAWQIVDVWESEEQARQFYDGRLTQAVEAVIGMTPPEAPSTAYELHTVVTP
jgi:hypothetical protein